jgi:meso-butanediol dehydrogenase/(S,S)-butanediol dehydrogenase/diacetyl reductase
MTKAAAMKGRLADKVALITGGAGDIGIAIAERFLAEGAATVALLDVSGAALDAAAARIGDPRVRCIRCDISSEPEIGDAIGEFVDGVGRLDVLVNNAAVREYHRLAAADKASWQRILAVNLIGSALVSAAALPALRASGKGAIVNVSSVFGMAGRAGMGQYDATKAAMISSTRVLAIEEAAHGVRVNAVCPGSVLTSFTLGRAAARGMSEKDLREKGFVPAPLSRWGEPAEIAAPVSWLASDEASFITGVILPVDGGLSTGGTRLA